MSPEEISRSVDAAMESPAAPAPQAVTLPLNDAPASTAESDAGDAAAAPVAALANDLAYTLTVGQARSLFASAGRKVPAERTLQNYCIEGTIAAQKIRTSYGSEWLINEPSLSAHIARQPVVTTAAPASPAAPPVAPPGAEPLNDALATAADSGAGAATGAAAAAPVGERRTIAEVLIENARLLATIDGRDQAIRGKDETIAELKDDRAFLRDEVREARQQRKDVKDIASRMLDAMQTIAIAGRLPPAKPGDGNVTARFVETDDASAEKA